MICTFWKLRLCAIFSAGLLVAGNLRAQETDAPPSSEPAPTATDSGSSDPSNQPPPAKPAPPPEARPVEPFVPKPSSTDDNSSSSRPSPFSSNAAGAPATVQSPPTNTGAAFSGPIGGDLFSFGDVVSNYFELGAPGDPSHPDKLRLTIGTNVGYDTNVLTTPTNPIASPTASLSGTASYGIGTQRFRLETALALGATYYQKRPSDTIDYNASLSARAIYFVTRRLQATGNLQLAYLSQPNPLLVGGSARFSGDYIVTNGGIEMSYSLRPRVSVNVGYQINGIKYTDEVINQQQGFYDQNFKLGASYLLTPRVSVNIDYRYNPVTYYGSGLGSDGHIVTMGFQATLAPRLKWKLDAGVEARLLKSTGASGGESAYLGPFFESELNYEFRPGALVSASLRYATEPSGLSAISIRQTLRGSLAFRYTFFGRITSDVGVVYENDYYDQPGSTGDFTQTIYSSYVGLQYLINPALAVTARFDYTDVTSDVELNAYTRAVTSLGLQVIF